LAAAIAAHEPDVAVLAEYRTATGARLAALLAEHGLTVAATTEPPPRKNGLALFARLPVEPGPASADPDLDQRRLRATVPGAGFDLLALHIPPKISIGVEGKERFWDRLLAEAAALRGSRALIVGDLNTGAPYRDEPRASLYCADRF